jgi:hypothetical protein
MPSCQNTARLSNAEGPPAAEEEEESISGGGFRCGPDLKTFFYKETETGVRVSRRLVR